MSCILVKTVGFERCVVTWGFMIARFLLYGINPMIPDRLVVGNMIYSASEKRLTETVECFFPVLTILCKVVMDDVNGYS